MHVRIAWEIYNHQKNKTDPKTIGGLPGSGLQPSGKLGPSSLDLLNKPGALPGAGSQPSIPKRPGQELSRPHQAPASLLPPASGHLRLPTPPSHFDPRDPYAAQRAYYGTSHLGRTFVKVDVRIQIQLFFFQDPQLWRQQRPPRTPATPLWLRPHSEVSAALSHLP